MRRKTRLFALAALAMLLVLTACGSRRPLREFVAASNGQNPTAGAGAGTEGGAVPGGNGAQPGAVSGNASGGPVAPVGGASQPAGGAQQTGGQGAGTGGGSGKSAGGQANTASDVGVSPTEIQLGNIATKSGSFGPYQFTSFYYGAAVFFDWLNDQGGINGRKVVLHFCDDAGSPTGNENCTRSLIGGNNKSSGVFAFVANNCLACDGIKYMSQQKVPLIGDLAIDFKDYAYPYTWRYDSNPYPQNGSIGYKGSLYQGTQQFRWFKQKVGVSKVGVIYYDNSEASKTAGLALANAARHEGMTAYTYAENVALPQWDSAVLDMKSKGVQALWDTVDSSGNQNLCKSIDSNGLTLKAKVSTISTWSQEVATQFDAPCRNYIYIVDTPGTAGYDETNIPEVATFRAAWAKYLGSGMAGELAEWALDGWAAGRWFADAAQSCGANLTRACVINYLNKPGGYGAHGLWWPRGNDKFSWPKSTYTACIVVAKWNDAKKTFTTVGDFHNTCSTTPYLSYPAPSS